MCLNTSLSLSFNPDFFFVYFLNVHLFDLYVVAKLENPKRAPLFSSVPDEWETFLELPNKFDMSWLLQIIFRQRALWSVNENVYWVLTEISSRLMHV